MEQAVRDVIARLIAALEPGDVVLGGGNVKKLKKLPPGCRTGDKCQRIRGRISRLAENRSKGIALNPNEQFREP